MKKTISTSLSFGIFFAGLLFFSAFSSATFGSTFEAMRIDASSTELFRFSSGELSRGNSSAEIPREWRVATYTTPELTREPEVVTQTEYVYEYVNVEPPKPIYLSRTGSSIFISISIFVMTFFAGFLYYRKQETKQYLKNTYQKIISSIT